MLDLCEDADANVRMMSIRGLPTLASSASETKRVAEAVLALLADNEEPLEKKELERNFNILINADAGACFSALFAQLKVADDAALRAKVLANLKTHLDRVRSEKKVDASLRSAIAAETKAVLDAGVDADDFKYFFNVFLWARDRSNAQDLSDIIFKTGGLDANSPPITAGDTDGIKKFTQAVGLARKHLYSGANDDPTALVSHFFSHVAPAFPGADEDASVAATQAVIELTPKVNPRGARTLFPGLLSLLTSLLPPLDAPADTEIRFSVLEPLFAGFHILGQRVPDAVADSTGLDFPTGQPATVPIATLESRRAEFVGRVKATHDKASKYLSELNEVRKTLFKTLAEAKEKEAKDETRKKLDSTKSAVRVCNAIVTLTTPLAKSQPAFVATSSALTWRPPQQPQGQQQQQQQKKGGQQQQQQQQQKRGKEGQEEKKGGQPQHHQQQKGSNKGPQVGQKRKQAPSHKDNANTPTKRARVEGNRPSNKGGNRPSHPGQGGNRPSHKGGNRPSNEGGNRPSFKGGNPNNANRGSFKGNRRGGRR